MKLKLTDDEKRVVHSGIRSALDTGEAWDEPNLHYPVGAIVAACEELGLVKCAIPDGRYGIDGFDTNGWQWDWWQQFKSPDGRLWTLAGSGYYGGHNFHLADEQNPQ